MPLRTFLAAGAAVLTAGVLTLNPGVADATTPHGPIAGVTVNGNATTGSAPVDGTFTSGTIIYPGFTAGCYTGTVGGTVDRGPNTAPKFRFTSLDLTCDSPLGTEATMSLDTSKPGCSTIDATMADSRVHTSATPGHVDSGAPTGDPGNVTGTGTINSQCVLVTVMGGCKFRVDGTFGFQLNEAITTDGGVNHQEVILTGSGLRARDPHPWCFNLVPNGSVITLNTLAFKIQVTGGTTTGIDITHGPIADGPIAGTSVNGSDTYGNVPIDAYANGNGTATVAGLTGSCVGAAGGTVQRGINPAAPHLTLNALNLSCSPFMQSLSLAPGCTVNANMSSPLVHDGLVDTVNGNAIIPNGCIVATGPATGCTYRISGNIALQFKEVPKTVGGTVYQDLVLSGNALTTSKATALCFGFIPNGSAITLNDVTLDVKVASGSIVTPGTPPTGAIDFHS